MVGLKQRASWVLLCAALAALALILLTPMTAAQQRVFAVVWTPPFAGVTFTPQLREINVISGATISSTPITLAGFTVTGATGLAVQPGTGTVFALLLVGATNTPRRLVTLDLASGVATDIGLADNGSGLLFADITFTSGGTLFGVTDDGSPSPETLFTLNTTSASPTFVRTLGNGSSGEAIGFNPGDGLIYHVSGFGVQNDPVNGVILETIDPASPLTPPVNVPLSVDGFVTDVESLFFWGNGFFLAGDVEGSLSLASTTGRIRDLGLIQGLSNISIDGLAIIGTPPDCTAAGQICGAAFNGPDGPSVLYSIDKGTGTAAMVGPIGVERVSGLAFNSAGTLFGAGERMDGSSAGVLITIDPATGLGTEIGPLFGLVQSFMTDLTFRHSDGVLFGHTEAGETVITIDTATGAGTVLPNGHGNGCCGHALAFDFADNLLVGSEIGISTVDQTTGIGGTITPFTFSPPLDSSSPPDAMDFDPATGTLFAIATAGSQTLLTTIDPATGIVTNLAPTQLNMDAIAFVPDAAAQPGVIQFSATTASIAENAGMVALSVTRTGGSAGAVGATFDTSDGTALAAAPDYTATNAVMVNFADGDTATKMVNVPITNDALPEAAETFNGTLSAPTGGATLGANNPIVVTITDDDSPPTIAINDLVVAEGGGMATFTVSLSAMSSQAVMVTAATASGTATSGADFTALPAMTVVTIPAGMLSAPVNVTITQDTLDETDETFLVNLSNPVNATLADSQGQGTITDDDLPPSITINDVAANEGANAVFTVTLSAASSFAVSVNFSTAAGTATAGSDFTTTSGTLNIPAGATTGTITVPLLLDAVADGGETFNVNLTMPVNATIGDAQGLGTINDAPANFTMTVTPPTQTRQPGQAANYTIHITPDLFVPTVDTSCSVAGTLISCATSGPITVGSMTATGTMTVQTGGFFGSLPRRPQAPLYAWWLPLSGFGAVGVVLLGANRKRLSGNRRAQYLALLSLLLAVTLLVGCPFGRDRQDEGTPGGTYPITVTATGSGVTRTATVDLVVVGTN